MSKWKKEFPPHKAVARRPKCLFTMKIAIVILTIIFFSISCEKNAIISLKNTNQNKIIALQPLGEYNEQQLASVLNEISKFFNTRVIILPSVQIPETFRSINEEKYSADSLVSFLSKFKNDTIVEVVGLTHNDIYTIREHQIRLNNELSVFYELRGIFGLGYMSGNSSVISDYRLMSNDKALLNNRLRKVIIHEIGHNLGLPHCSDDLCLMSEANGNIATLNKVGGDYCIHCKRKLN